MGSQNRHSRWQAAASEQAINNNPRFRAFMALVLLPICNLMPEDGEPETGPIQVWINAEIHADYRTRGVFPILAGKALSPVGRVTERVSPGMARALLVDAYAQAAKDPARKAAQKWRMLAQRLRAGLRSHERQEDGHAC